MLRCSNAAALRSSVQHTVGLRSLPASRWAQASQSIRYAAPLARDTQRGRIVGQPVALGSISGVKRYSTEASELAATVEQSAADLTTSFEKDDEPQRKQSSRRELQAFQDHVLLEIAGAGSHPDGGPLEKMVSKNVVKQELKWLKDPKALADRVATILQAHDRKSVALAVQLVRAAQKENMECSVAWNHLLEYCMKRRQPKAAWKLYNEVSTFSFPSEVLFLHGC